MDYTVVKAETPEDHHRVQRFVYDHYVPDMSLVQTFGLDELPPVRPLKYISEENAFCLMAIDSQGGIVGVATNRESVEYEMDPDFPPQVNKMMQFYDWVEREARLETLPEKTIELEVVVVHREWRKRGLARILGEESVRQAQESGYQAMRACCINEYTARLARALGWRQHYRLRYSDYPSRAGVDVALTPEPPHLYIYYYVVDL